MNLIIRKIEESDIDGYWAALDSVVNERKYLQTIRTPSREDTSVFVRKNIENSYAQYIALVDDAVVGWADILPYQSEITSHVGLLGMGVISEFRGKGIGKKILKETISEARGVNIKRIELEVFAKNSTAIALYRQVGFEHEGIKRGARYINGRYEDVCIMGKCYF